MNEEKPVFTFAAPGKYTIENASNPLTFVKPSYNITFRNESGTIGTLDFNGPEMRFTGNAEESAKVFFDWLAKSFAGRLEQERQSAAGSEPLGEKK